MVLTELMRVYLRSRKPQKLGTVEAILTINRKDAENLALLARLRSQLGENDKAISLYQEALALRFHLKPVGLSQLLRSQGQCQQAIKLYTASLKLGPMIFWQPTTRLDSCHSSGRSIPRWSQGQTVGQGHLSDHQESTLSAWERRLLMPSLANLRKPSKFQRVLLPRRANSKKKTSPNVWPGAWRNTKEKTLPRSHPLGNSDNNFRSAQEIRRRLVQGFRMNQLSPEIKKTRRSRTTNLA